MSGLGDDELTRRALLARGLRAGGRVIGAAGTVGAIGAVAGTSGLVAGCGQPVSVGAPVEVVPGLLVHPRSTWGDDLAPTGPIAPDTMRFMIVHHSESPNNGADPRSTIRGIFRYHTGPAKRWPDVCYHYFIGRDGSIWEGRAGSLAGPVEASATGGNQGWAVLVCLLGDYSRVPPPAAAQDSLVKVLAWNAHRYGIDPTGHLTYRSRGSNRFPAGSVVTTPAICGHRDATYTDCPGDAAYALLDEWRARVTTVPPPVFPAPGPYSPADRLRSYDVG